MKSLYICILAISALSGCSSLMTPSLAESKGMIHIDGKVTLSGSIDVTAPKLLHFNNKEVDLMLAATQKGGEPTKVPSRHYGETVCRAGYCELFPQFKPGIGVFREDLLVMSKLLKTTLKTGRKETAAVPPFVYHCHREVCDGDFKAELQLKDNEEDTREVEVFKVMLKAFAELSKESP